MIKRVILFLVLNFSALAIGGSFTGKGVPSAWYQNLDKAPWTPPGWVFGSAWTLIMICFAIYMAYLVVSGYDQKKVITLFAIQWILNVAWNPVFFYYHEVVIGFITISLLTILITYLLFNFRIKLKLKSLLLAPYFVWLIIATSLNGYILLFN